MKSIVLNGQTYEIPEMTFEQICRLEENGVYLLNLNRKDRNVASMLRGIVAWIIDAEPEVASATIQAHLEKGGRIDDILVAVREAMEESGFFGKSTRTEGPARPMLQDHQRQNNNRRKNTHHTQRS